MAGAPPITTTARTLSFLPGIAERLGYYVYALRDPTREGELFYVGKGKGDRVYQHAAQALAVDPDEGEVGLKLARIRSIHDAGQEVGVEIIRHGLTEGVAFEVEAAVSDALRLAGRDLTNRVAGRGTFERGWAPLPEIRVRYTATPAEIRRADRVVLIRINRLYRPTMTPDELYEATRKWWRINPRRNPQFAFAVYHGIVREVYRIDGWEGPEHVVRNGKTSLRWGFSGSIDAEATTLYKDHSVHEYLPRGLRTPTVYVNC